jgi:hypothetical protein
MRRLTPRDDRGATTLFVVLTMPFLLLAGVLVFDGGRGIVAQRQTQNAADAGALAKATDCLKGTSTDFAPYETNGAVLDDDPADPEPDCLNSDTTVWMKRTISPSFNLGLTDRVVRRSATAKWGALTSGVIFPFTFSTCAFPDTFTQGSSTTTGTLMMLYGQGVARTSCPRDSNTAGQDANSKGFIAGGCQLTSVGGTLVDAQGNSFIGTNCDSANLDYFVGKDVLLPVWGAAAGTPSNYTITSLVGFHVLGWSGNGNNRGGAMQARCTATGGFKGDPATVGDDQKPCLYGYVTTFTTTTGGSSGAPCFADPLSTVCVIYLDS